MTANAQPLEILEDLLKRAKAKGAEAADCLIVRDVSLNVAQRLGKREKLERSEAQDLGLRVFIGKRQAIVSTSDLEPKTLDELAERAVAMARAVPEDEYCGLADPALLVKTPVALDLEDKKEPSEAELTDMIARAEDAARAVPGVTNSEGAEAGWGKVQIALAASNGFRGGYADQPLGHQRLGAGRRRHRHGARLRFLERGVRRELVRPRDARASRPASARCGGSIRARLRPRRSRSSTTRASPTA